MIIIVVGRRMARTAIRQPLVAEIGIIPIIIGVVTIGALAGEVVAGGRVTGLTIIKAVMIEVHVAPTTGIMTV
jgi:hypothetical protein